MYNIFITIRVQNLFYFRNNFESIIILGDFYVEPINAIMTTFMAENNFHDITKSNTCLQTPSGRYIDLILTNKPNSFQNTGVKETIVSDHYLLILLFLKNSFLRLPSKKIFYRIYLTLDVTGFLNYIRNLLE